MPSISKILALGLAMASAAAVAWAGKTKQSPDNPSTASMTDNYMGPAAFMWPPDRVWSGDMDNQPPCGSRASAGKRTLFPLTNCDVALVAQDDYYNTKISISYSNDPTSNDDFSTLLETADIRDLNPGHTCPRLPDAPPHVSAGDNATLQIIYRADWNAPHNQTLYACADITFVARADFKFRIPCFNATEPGEDDKAAAEAAAEAVAKPAEPNGAESKGAESKGAESNGSVSAASLRSGGSKMSEGEIAGATIGSLAAIFLICGSLFLYRRHRQKKRSLRRARMEDYSRQDHVSMSKYSASQKGT